MITINAFWFGVLMTLFAFFVFMFIAAYVSARRSDKSKKYEEYEPSEEEFLEALEEMTGKNFRIVKKNGFMIGEIVGDNKDESEDH